MQSRLWSNWRSRSDGKTCQACSARNGKIYALTAPLSDRPPLHPRCRCWLEPLQSILPGTATSAGRNGADWWLVVYGRLPDYYISYDEAIALGWDPKRGNLADVLPGRMITRGIYENGDGRLPDAPGRVWREADINYTNGRRNKSRVLFSSDGLVFVTYDHYKTFIEVQSAV